MTLAVCHGQERDLGILRFLILPAIQGRERDMTAQTTQSCHPPLLNVMSRNLKMPSVPTFTTDERTQL